MTAPRDPLERMREEGRAATHGEAVMTGVASGRRLREPITVSGLFDDRGAVDHTVDALYAAGIPRDLVEVVVSHQAAARYYADAPRAPRPLGRETFRFAGIGGLIGFLVGVGVGLVAVAMPGIENAGGMAPVQLLGPNMATIGGAAIGAVIGFFRRQRPHAQFARAAEETGAIVLAVAARSDEEARLLAELITSHGGREVRAE